MSQKLTEQEKKQIKKDRIFLYGGIIGTMLVMAIFIRVHNHNYVEKNGMMLTNDKAIESVLDPTCEYDLEGMIKTMRAKTVFDSQTVRSQLLLGRNIIVNAAKSDEEPKLVLIYAATDEGFLGCDGEGNSFEVEGLFYRAYLE